MFPNLLQEEIGIRVSQISNLGNHIILLHPNNSMRYKIVLVYSGSYLASRPEFPLLSA
jgi:hypothetical protein